MTDRPFAHHFERLNAPQIRADRAADRIYSWSLIVGLAFAGFCMAVVLSLGVQ